MKLYSIPTFILQKFCPGRGTVSYLEGGLRGMALLALTMLLSVSTISAQTFSETRQQTALFQSADSPDNELYLHNINGNVTVEGYDGEVVQISYEKEIEADTQRDLERAKEEVEFIVEEDGDRIFIYLDAPFIHVKTGSHGISYNINNWDSDYNFTFHITVRVPRNTNLGVSTINGGKLLVENTRGRWLDASNVNGRVDLLNVTGVTDANTINGDIMASYTESPNENSSYETINGTIEVLFPDNLSADISFKSMHGDLYTDFENVQRLEARVESDTNSKRGTTTYRIDKFAPLRIGDGGPEFSFEVLNGSVYIKRNRSI